jgi:hypothetical protein
MTATAAPAVVTAMKVTEPMRLALAPAAAVPTATTTAVGKTTTTTTTPAPLVKAVMMPLAVMSEPTSLHPLCCTWI